MSRRAADCGRVQPPSLGQRKRLVAREDEPVQRAADEGCELLTDSCAASGLTDDIPSPQLVEALQAVWAEVVACQEGERINYEACLAALTDCGPADDSV